MTTPAERTQAVLQTRAILAALAAPPGISDDTLNDLRVQAAQLLEHYPNEQDMRSANWNCPTLFGKLPKPPGNIEEARKKTFSDWVYWLLFEDSERGQNVICAVGLVGIIAGVGTVLAFNLFGR